MKFILCSLLITTLGLSACSKPTDHKSTAPAEKPQGVLTEAQKKTLDQSKQVEKVLDDANEKRMKDVDEAAEK